MQFLNYFKAVTEISRLLPTSECDENAEQMLNNTEDDGFLRFSDNILKQNRVINTNLSVADDISKYLTSPNANGRVIH